jgi:hypothetical protein
MGTEKYGYWGYLNKKFLNKFEALANATSTTKHEVKFRYHDQVWSKFDRTLLGKYSLNELYKQRAQQLRDKYDYLILYYSGGADSHNILRTFIDNNILLDEVCVKWPKLLMDGGLYTPNQHDTSAKNYWSEWNYSVKPTLEWLSQNHPSIKITIKDYTDSIDKLKIEPMFEKLNFVRGGGILLNSVISTSENIVLDKGKTVSHIYGIDKPLLHTDEKHIFMFFSDVCLDQACRSELVEDSTECFYWAPDFPLLPFEQAYQLSLYYKANPHTQKFLWNDLPTPLDVRTMKNQFQNSVARQLLYDNWDGRFQADKPSSSSRKDKFFWFYEHSELENVRMNYYDSLKQRVELIDTKYLAVPTDGSIPVYNVCVSNKFYITTI